MNQNQINLRVLKRAVNAILDHLTEDLTIETVRIEEKEDFYWDCPYPELHDMSKKPLELEVGRLSDDVDFVKFIERGQSGDVSYNLIHLAPLFRYIGETVRK